MNEKFRNTGATDVCPFSGREAGGSECDEYTAGARSNEKAAAGAAGVGWRASLGDIAIAPAVAKRNAKTYGRTVT